ncbi:MAG: DUF1684 domain-containing protein [Cytophagales bacterium]|nr:DUF1684 domain-containing protein [Bernardetiaceae bacterium]MDW8204869.1 DUF1684 domain-containing protein [Cytophagales bacterium]
MKTYLPVFLTIILFGFAACSSSKETTVLDYVNEINKWHREREEKLKKEDGWLNLIGLFWLREGINTVGADEHNEIVFPSDKAPAKLGEFILQKGKVRFVAEPKAEVTIAGHRITDTLIFSEEQKKPVVLAHGSLRWFIIKRGNRYGVRLRDLEHPAVKSFTGIPMFDIDPRWRIRARIERAADTHKIAITDVLGQVSWQTSPGTLVFNWQGKTYRLDALESDKQLFILFGDETNKNQTYGAGRFLYADLPDSTGYTILDFNKAINPPCAFTGFATCPLPPPQNRLAIAIKAGEKRYTQQH